MAGDGFAELLRELKERSGLSYGALGKRLHMSASTVHRYVSGDVVPTEYAPVERLARICRATPEELLELHRRWVRADALRGVKPAESAAGAGAGPGDSADEQVVPPAARPEAPTVPRPKGPTGAEPAAEPGPRPESRPRPEALPDPEPGLVPEPGPGPDAGRDPGPEPGRELRPEGGPGPAAMSTRALDPARDAAPRPRRASRKRSAALLAGAGIVTVAVATALVVNLVPGHADGPAHDADAARQVAASAPATASAPHAGPSAGTTRSASPTPPGTRTAPASGTASPRGTRAAGPSGTVSDRAVTTRAPAVPVTVATTPYYWDQPCDQDFLVDRSPRNVPPPPTQQDAVGWTTALGGVAADHQMVALTVQGTGAQTVVLQALHVRVVRSDAPLTWNKYAVGVGCGGGVQTASFDVSLDLGNPLVNPIAGQRDFPYKVSESDPEVFYVNGHTSGHDVSWYLELDWSSGGRHGTLRVDDHGRPFRTSGSQKSYYGHPLGGNEWVPYSGE
ncbi:helix-turn-helix domain-containing protein [Streptomyces sp. NPDC015220]|uniref:helix-turn-helix domain-containing protein n=1 Tax=Streptomyces sp. NPDC015220 TaxID=3364947 RepID=UPI0037011B30